MAATRNFCIGEKGVEMACVKNNLNILDCIQNNLHCRNVNNWSLILGFFSHHDKGWETLEIRVQAQFLSKNNIKPNSQSDKAQFVIGFKNPIIINSKDLNIKNTQYMDSNKVKLTEILLKTTAKLYRQENYLHLFIFMEVNLIHKMIDISETLPSKTLPIKNSIIETPIEALQAEPINNNNNNKLTIYKKKQH